MTSAGMQTATRLTFDPDTSYGTIDRTSQDAKSYGGAVQAVDKTRLFGMGNQFLIGASYDHGDVDYTPTASSASSGRSSWSTASRRRSF